MLLPEDGKSIITVILCDLWKRLIAFSLYLSMFVQSLRRYSLLAFVQIIELCMIKAV